jgi:tetratricopeptide (TPR) repeat protein
MERWWQRWRRNGATGEADRTSEDTGAENLIELAALERMLTRANGFRVAFAVVNHPALCRRLTETVHRDLEDRRFVEVTLDPDGADSVILAIEQAAASSPDGLFIFGLEALNPLEGDSDAIRDLNLNRDHLRTVAPIPMVFWAPDYAVRTFARQAADLWSGRSGVYRLVGESDDVEATSRVAADGLDWSATPKERDEREALLKDLLEELDEGEDQPAARAAALAGLAAAASMRSRYDEASDLYQQALPIYRETGNRLGEANTLHALGEAASRQSRYDEASDLYQQALPIYREIGNRLGEANTLAGYGLVLLEQGSSSASEILADAARIYELRGDAGRAQWIDARIRASGEASP